MIFQKKATKCSLSFFLSSSYILSFYIKIWRIFFSVSVGIGYKTWRKDTLFYSFLKKNIITIFNISIYKHQNTLWPFAYFRVTKTLKSISKHILKDMFFDDCNIVYKICLLSFTVYKTRLDFFFFVGN